MLKKDQLSSRLSNIASRLDREAYNSRADRLRKTEQLTREYADLGRKIDNRVDNVCWREVDMIEDNPEAKRAMELMDVWGQESIFYEILNEWVNSVIYPSQHKSNHKTDWDILMPILEDEYLSGSSWSEDLARFPLFTAVVGAHNTRIMIGDADRLPRKLIKILMKFTENGGFQYDPFHGDCASVIGYYTGHPSVNATAELRRYEELRQQSGETSNFVLSGVRWMLLLDGEAGLQYLHEITQRSHSSVKPWQAQHLLEKIAQKSPPYWASELTIDDCSFQHDISISDSVKGELFDLAYGSDHELWEFAGM